MSDNPYATQNKTAVEQISVEPTGMYENSVDWQSMLLGVAAQQRALSLTVIAASQVALFGYFVLALYSSFLSGATPKPTSFLVIFFSFTFLPTVVAVFLFRCSQLNKDWALGKGDAANALVGAKMMYKSATWVVAGYIVLGLILCLGLLGITPSLL